MSDSFELLYGQSYTILPGTLLPGYNWIGWIFWGVLLKDTFNLTVLNSRKFYICET